MKNDYGAFGNGGTTFKKVVMKLKKQEMSELQELAATFVELDEERQEADRKSRALKKKLDQIKERLQEAVGVTEERDVPYVTSIGIYQISQILKHRDVEAYSYDYIDFKIVKA